MFKLFTKEEITYMRTLGLDLDYSNLSEADLNRMEEVIINRLQLFGIDENYELTEDGVICELIIDKLTLDC